MKPLGLESISHAIRLDATRRLLRRLHWWLPSLALFGVTTAHFVRHRVDRQGYQAGALEEGRKNTEAEFIAIFDADLGARVFRSELT